MQWNQSDYSRNRRAESRAMGRCIRCNKRPALLQRMQCCECQMDSIIQEAFKFDRRRSMPGSTATRNSCYVDQFKPELRKQWRQAIKSKFNGRCFYTGLLIEIGSTAGLDHMLPVSRAATFGPARVFHPDNLVWCHESINRLKGDKTANEFEIWLRHDLPVALATLDAQRAINPAAHQARLRQRASQAVA
jgi:hypothetical protein